MPPQLQSRWTAPLWERPACHVAEHTFSPSLWKGQEHLSAALQVLHGHCRHGAGTAPGPAPSLPRLSALCTSHTGGAHRSRLQPCFVLALTPSIYPGSWSRQLYTISLLCGKTEVTSTWVCWQLWRKQFNYANLKLNLSISLGHIPTDGSCSLSLGILGHLLSQSCKHLLEA